MSILEAGAKRIADVSARFEAALAQDVGWEALQRGLRQSYRTARVALDRVEETRSVDDFHTWRKRTKELTYQLELLTLGLGSPAADLRQRFAEFSRSLGIVTDRYNLANELLEGAPKRRRKLAKAVRKEGKRRMKIALSEGRQLFRFGPKRFAREVIVKVIAGHDAENAREEAENARVAPLSVV